MRIYSRIAECSLSYAKIMQTSAMRIYSRIAECSLSYAKIMQTSAIENLFSYFRVQFILCKDNASCGKDKIINKVFCIGRNLYKYSSQNCEFSNKTPFVLKNAKIGHFTPFGDKSLIIKNLSRFSLFLALLDHVFGLVILQRRLR